MSLATYEYVCENGHVFHAAGASGAYGEFVVRGEISPEPGLLIAIGDPVYAEIDRILGGLGAYAGKDANERADILQDVFGLACDPAPDQTQPKIERVAPCPICGSREMRSWDARGPYHGSYFTVTHLAWSQLDQSEKENFLQQALVSR